MIDYEGQFYLLGNYGNDAEHEFDKTGELFCDSYRRDKKQNLDVKKRIREIVENLSQKFVATQVSQDERRQSTKQKPHPKTPLLTIGEDKIYIHLKADGNLFFARTKQGDVVCYEFQPPDSQVKILGAQQMSEVIAFCGFCNKGLKRRGGNKDFIESFYCCIESFEDSSEVLRKRIKEWRSLVFNDELRGGRENLKIFLTDLMPPRYNLTR